MANFSTDKTGFKVIVSAFCRDPVISESKDIFCLWLNYLRASTINIALFLAPSSLSSTVIMKPT